jgi:hypothetical protein
MALIFLMLNWNLVYLPESEATKIFLRFSRSFAEGLQNSCGYHLPLIAMDILAVMFFIA